MTKQTNGWQESGFRWRRWRAETPASSWFHQHKSDWLVCICTLEVNANYVPNPREQEMSRVPQNSEQNKGRGGQRQGSDWGSDTQETEWKQGRVRDSENGSKRKPKTMTKRSFQRETRTQQQSLVTYDNPENDSAYHGLSRSSCTAVFCDNIVQTCLVPSLTLSSLRRNTIHQL